MVLSSSQAGERKNPRYQVLWVGSLTSWVLAVVAVLSASPLATALLGLSLEKPVLWLVTVLRNPAKAHRLAGGKREQTHVKGQGLSQGEKASTVLGGGGVPSIPQEHTWSLGTAPH